MANVVTTNYFREQVAGQNVSLSADAFAVALMNIHVQSASESTLKQVQTWSEVSAYEVSAAGYSAEPLSADTLSANTNNVVYWDGNNITWSSVTISPYGYTIYRISDGLVVGFVEFTTAPQTTVNGDLTIQWNANGIMNIISP